jgi:hypothetical protein
MKSHYSPDESPFRLATPKRPLSHLIDQEQERLVQAQEQREQEREQRRKQSAKNKKLSNIAFWTLVAPPLVAASFVLLGLILRLLFFVLGIAWPTGPMGHI